MVLVLPNSELRQPKLLGSQARTCRKQQADLQMHETKFTDWGMHQDSNGPKKKQE